MPSWLRVASLVGAIAVATSSSATDGGPAQKPQPLLALVQDARDLSVGSTVVFQSAADFGDVVAFPSLNHL
jgi:poly(beta-D-mannuronate) C5 epimerase